MKRIKGRARRHIRMRRKAIGTDKRPRMVVYRSLRNIYVQLVDDMENKTILSLSTSASDLKKGIGYGGNNKAAATLGGSLAKKALDKGIKHIVFDRSGYKYHGRVKTLAEAALKGGLSFAKERKPRDTVDRKSS